MAKAGDRSSTVVWVWLRDALACAITALGSETLAKAQLRKWLAAKKLLWDCMEWTALRAERIAKLERERQEPVSIRIERRGLLEPDRVILPGSFMQTPTTAYLKGDCRFWADAKLEINWVDNSAREVITDGSRALGIRVSRKQLLKLLPAISQSALATADEPASPPKQHRKAGAKPKYDWDTIQAHCHQWFNDNGFPENVSAFCRDEVIPWCEQRYGEDGTPDMETLRPLVTRWIAAWGRSLLPK